MMSSFHINMNGLSIDNNAVFSGVVHFNPNRNYSTMPKGEFIKTTHRPFFAFRNENGTVRSFLDAVVNNSQEQANTYVSKSLMVDIDFSELRRIFDGAFNYSVSYNYYYEKTLGHTLANVTVLKKDKDKKHLDILYIKMIDEPDIFGRWKIYQIMREE